MELLLWRWSTAVQVVSDIMIALFFISLAVATKRIELRPWVHAWLANLCALAIALVFWLWQPTQTWLFGVITGLYILFKCLFVGLLLSGLQNYIGISMGMLRAEKLVIISVVLAIFGGLLIPSINWLGAIQSSVIFLTLATGAMLALRSQSKVLGWIIVGFTTRGALALAEAFSYGYAAITPTDSSQLLPLFLASHSSFDSAAEWCIALGCVLALYRTIQGELTTSCDNLLEVKRELQELADKDTLTGLFNRRSLRRELDRAKLTGASILFFDLDDFKKINDRYGHNVGDECLQLFAQALTINFRQEDKIFRYAGDEFVIVAKGVKPEMTDQRIDASRQYLKQHNTLNIPIDFSVGSAYLAVGGEPEQALHQADKAMYELKSLETN
ncbi:diguanylate cyclase [Colwelliaceae bacterium 6471]